MRTSISIWPEDVSSFLTPRRNLAFLQGMFRSFSIIRAPMKVELPQPEVLFRQIDVICGLVVVHIISIVRVENIPVVHCELDGVAFPLPLALQGVHVVVAKGELPALGVISGACVDVDRRLFGAVAAWNTVCVPG